ncbi:MAG: translocation/assembly module TamB domain-containing protein [Alphaproteobacteria bacterium]|nr:translocation/assembly module TamB domain-containing protein [Alphaproteobacteria bacterium]
MPISMRHFKNISMTLITMVVVTLACIQIPYVKSHLVQRIVSRVAAPHGVSVKVDGVHGILPFHLSVKSIHIADSSGALAEVHDLHVNVAARMLLRGKMQIESITVNQLEWHQKTASASQKTTNQLPTMLTTVLPIVLDQTVLKRVHINVLKTPAANLSFHFQKQGVESLVELKSITKATNDDAPVEGSFRFSPKAAGATANLRLIDRVGMLNGSPITVEGAIQIENLDTFLPVGDVTINTQHKKTIVQLSTVGSNTRVHVKSTDTDISLDLSIKQMLEQRTTHIKNIVARTQEAHVRGKGNLSYDPDRIVLDGQGSHDGGTDLTFKATWALQEQTAHIDGSGHWETTAFQFTGDLGNIGINVCLKKATLAVNGHAITLHSPKGLSLDDHTDLFTFKINDHVFEGTAALNRNGYLMRLKPTWQWVGNNVVAIHINATGARIEGAFDIDCAKLTNDTVYGAGHATFHLDHTLSGTLSCTLPEATVGGATFGKTAATVQFNKVNGVLNLTTGAGDIAHLPHGSAKGHLLFQKQIFQLESFQLAYQKHIIALKESVSIGFNVEKIPSFSMRVGQKGSIHCVEKEKQIIFENIPLITARMFVPSWDMDGLLNGKIEIHHPFDQWKGQFVLSKLIPYLSSPLTNNTLFKDFSWTIQLERQAKQLLIDMHTQRRKAQIFKAKGSISLDASTFLKNTVNFNVAGELDVSLLSSLFNTHDRLGGILNLNLNVEGTLADINMSGRINARDGLYDSADNGTHIANIAGTLKASGKKLMIERLAGNDVRDPNNVNKNSHLGTVDIMGGFEFVGLALPNFALNLKLNDLIVVHRDDMTIRATGDIKINGPGLQSKITGAVTLSPSLIMLEEFSNDDVSYIEIKELEVQKKEKQKSASPLFPIELALTIDKNFYIRDLDLGLMSQWTGFIMVKGDISSPYLEGTLNATKGKLSFFGKPLKISEAKITFDREHRNAPNIWLVAMREVEDVTVYLQVSGYAPSPKISFVSDPALQEDEVLARLLFGKELNKISTGQSVQLASIGTSLNDKKGMNFLENLRSSFGFDTFELKENAIKANTEESGQTATQALSIGKEFENMRVSIDQSIGSAGSKATVSTALAKNVYLDLEVGEKNAGSGAGLSWLFRY